VEIKAFSSFYKIWLMEETRMDGGDGEGEDLGWMWALKESTQPESTCCHSRGDLQLYLISWTKRHTTKKAKLESMAFFIQLSRP